MSPWTGEIAQTRRARRNTANFSGSWAASCIVRFSDAPKDGMHGRIPRESRATPQSISLARKSTRAAQAAFCTDQAFAFGYMQDRVDRDTRSRSRVGVLVRMRSLGARG